MLLNLRNSGVDGARGDWFLILIVANDSYSVQKWSKRRSGRGNEPTSAIRRRERSPFLGCDVDSSVPPGSIA